MPLVQDRSFYLLTSSLESYHCATDAPKSFHNVCHGGRVCMVKKFLLVSTEVQVHRIVTFHFLELAKSIGKIMIHVSFMVSTQLITFFVIVWISMLRLMVRDLISSILIKIQSKEFLYKESQSHQSAIDDLQCHFVHAADESNFFRLLCYSEEKLNSQKLLT